MLALPQLSRYRLFRGDRSRSVSTEIIRRAAEQPGIVLADEVGMGKTLVALGVAMIAALADRGKRPCTSTAAISFIAILAGTQVPWSNGQGAWIESGQRLRRSRSP